MAQILISNLSFAHDGAAETLFDNVNLTLDTDWRLGFIGRNGRGKTTFLQLLLGRYEYRGTIVTPMAFEYFPPAVPDEDRKTLDLADALAPGLEPWRLERELSLLSVDQGVLERPFRTLSGGERTKFLLATRFLRDERFLLIDEPTNHLDGPGRTVVGDYLRSKKGFILVSHDRDLLDRCVDHILSLDRVGLELQKGNFSAWQQNRDYRERFERARENTLRNDIRQLGEAARRAAGWSDRVERSKKGAGPVDRGFIGHQAARLMKRSKSVENRRLKALDEKKELLRNVEMSDRLSLTPGRPVQRRLATLSGVSVAYDGRPLFRDFNLTVDLGERIFLSGPNGCGKTSLLRLVLGEEVPHQGLVRRAPGLLCSYVPQEVGFLGGLKMGLKEWISRNTLDESRFKAILHKLGFEKKHFEGELGRFSEGQKKKLLLAASLASSAHLYIWDEPFNYIDIISRMQIEELILTEEPTLLLVEHDRRFAEKVATSVVELGGSPEIKKN